MAIEIVEVLMNRTREISPMEFYVLCTDIDLNPEHLEAVVIALGQGYGQEDIAALQTMVDEIKRQEQNGSSSLCEKTHALIDTVFTKLDELNVDYRRLVHEGLDHVASLAGDF